MSFSTTPQLGVATVEEMSPPAGDDHGTGTPGKHWRRFLGWTLLCATVLMWTLSNFLFSFMFADATYSKPLFVTYVNTISFVGALPFVYYSTSHEERDLWHEQMRGWDYIHDIKQWLRTFPQMLRSNARPSREPRDTDCSNGDDAERRTLLDPPFDHASVRSPLSAQIRLTLPQTIAFAAKFSALWVLANYFTAACFEDVSVASGTVLVSTSSFWTLLLAKFLHVEPIHWHKMAGVFLSLAGVVMILSNDLFGSGNDEQHRGSFPEKSQKEVALGSSLALASAIMYGVYGTFAKSALPDENKANMPLVFVLVGAFNALCVLPLLILWHITGIERFELPPNRQVWLQLLVNALLSVVSDFSWLYAVLLTSPVVVTVVLSLTIPLSLLGQVVARGQYATGLNVVGSIFVSAACILVNLE